MTDVLPPTRRSLRRYVPLVVGVVLMVICAIFIIRVLADDWNEVRDQVTNASLWWLGAGLAAALAGMLIVASNWSDALAVVGADVPRRKAIPWFFTGEIGKYIPGAIWAALGRSEIARRNGVPVAQSYSSVALSLVGMYLAAVLSAAIVLPFDLAHQRHAGPVLLLLLLVPIGLAALHPKVLGTAVHAAERATNRSIPVTIPPWRSTVLLVLRYVPAWVGIAAATWCVARALPGVDAPVLRIVLATLLSWTAGFVTPTPGGAGVREAVFIGISGIAAGPAVAVAVTSRILFVTIDVVGALLGAPLSRPRVSQEVSVGSGTPESQPVTANEEGR